MLALVAMAGAISPTTVASENHLQTFLDGIQLAHELAAVVVLVFAQMGTID